MTDDERQMELDHREQARKRDKREREGDATMPQWCALS